MTAKMLRRDIVSENTTPTEEILSMMPRNEKGEIIMGLHSPISKENIAKSNMSKNTQEN